jgi:nucleoside-diphosphate-sugar epimerase
MKIAITGATGFLGKYLIKYLLDCNYDVLVIARPEENAQGCFSFDVNIYESDYSINSLEDIFVGVDSIVHLAAQTMQRDTDPLKVSNFFHVNVQIYEDVLIAAQKCNVKQIIQMSSNSVYSPVNRLPFLESDNPIPATIYGVSKLYSEKLGEYVAYKTGMNVISLRLARLYGFGERDSVVFTKYMKLAINSEPIEVWGEGKTEIEYLYVKDVVEAIEVVVRKKIESGVYNVGTNRSYSVMEIAKTINKVCDNEGNLIIDKSKPDNGYNILMDSSKFYNATNWTPKWNLEEAIFDIYNYYSKD